MSPVSSTMLKSASIIWSELKEELQEGADSSNHSFVALNTLGVFPSQEGEIHETSLHNWITNILN